MTKSAAFSMSPLKFWSKHSSVGFTSNSDRKPYQDPGRDHAVASASMQLNDLTLIIEAPMPIGTKQMRLVGVNSVVRRLFKVENAR